MGVELIVSKKVFIKNNSDYYNSFKEKYKKSGNILLVSFSRDIRAANTLMKIGKSYAIYRKSDLVVIHTIFPNEDVLKISKSYHPRFNILLTHKIIWKLVQQIFPIISIISKLKRGNDLLSLKHENHNIGKYIYDYILRKNKIPTIDTIDANYYIQIIYGYLIAVIIKEIITKYKPTSIVCLDNVYLEGILFELAKDLKIECITGINVNRISFHLYDDYESYNQHCRTPDDYILKKYIENKNDEMNAVNQYLSKRYSGLDPQHDAIRAFSPEKKRYEKDQLESLYKLDGLRENILILPHIFQDAPHAYPATIFADYFHWLKYTLDILDNSREYNIIIKEHPSAILYGENGFLEAFIQRNDYQNVKILDPGINTYSLHQIANYMITCGGTAGMEFAAAGVKVILASKPPYADYGIATIAKDPQEYESILKNLNSIPDVNRDQRTTASALLYIINVNMEVDNELIGLGNTNYGFGDTVDEDTYYRSIYRSEDIKRGHEAMIKMFKNMSLKSARNIYRDFAR
jgi:hypothetical protein